MPIPSSLAFKSIVFPVILAFAGARCFAAAPVAGEYTFPEKSPLREQTAVGLAVGENKATPLSRIKVAPGFQVELLYSVPGVDEGSWINLCLDPKGRILASDQFGGLYRFTPPPPGKTLTEAQIEKVPAAIRAANGMVWAFGALYVGVNDYQNKIPSGLYRVSDSDGDDQLDKVELLRAIKSKGDHGVHAVVPTPDGKALYLICGNRAEPTEFDPYSPVPPIWGEDHLLPRMPDGRGFMRDTLAPGGIVYRVSPDGKDFKVVASGFRNIFDAAVARDGELFTYDADMEWDFNTSWYRPTRINHVVSGAEFGWRNGAGKRPAFYVDNLGSVIDIGPGSPTGTTFGYGARFPARYQNALYALDWSWGKMYAIHLEPDGASYRATKEEFLSGSPLPLTDAIINPADGAMYFTIGGRRVQSGIYRVTYAGSEPTAPAVAPPPANAAATLRKKLESFHGKPDAAALDAAWPHLGDQDRNIRWAARTAVEHQPPALWAERALHEPDPAIRIEAVLALARSAGISPPQRTPASPPVDRALGKKLLAALVATDWNRLDDERRLAFVRTAEIVLNRFDLAPSSETAPLLARLEPLFPAATPELNWLLCETLVYLESPTVAAKALDLMAAAPTQEEQIEYARSLRMLRTGWTPELRKTYFEWFQKAANYRGGLSFAKFIEFIRHDALATLTDAERVALAPVLEKKIEPRSAIENFGAIFEGRTPRVWTVEELSAKAATSMKNRDFDDGRRMFGAAACFACHRFGNEGGMTGPDLTTSGGRYSAHDLIDQIINPSKVINDQYVPSVLTKNDGQTVVGTVVNLSGDDVVINTDLTDPYQRVTVDRKEVKSIEYSTVSPMPPMLLASMTEDEIMDLIAYVLSGGDRDNGTFKPAAK